ncbi:MAG: zinc ribbon domain-containing protein [Candidatus Omnitrophica bacterium]|nr:zinc ribbon domain-containing protein [Candidatus Omnitrophota bacterium]
MPIYTYKCDNCEETFDLLIRNSLDESLIFCQICSCREVKKLPAIFGFTNKGKTAVSSKSCSGGNCSNCSGCG